MPGLSPLAWLCGHQRDRHVPKSRAGFLPPGRAHPPSPEGSTLRKTLGCLLADELGIQLRRVGSGNRVTFVEGEQVLSAWMAENAYVSWVVLDRPWELEEELIAALDVPLNLKENSRNQFHPVLTQARAQCLARAWTLPVLPNPGIGGR